MTRLIFAALLALAALGLAYAAGQATRATATQGRPVMAASGLRRMGASLFASLTGVLVGVTPFLIVAQTAPVEVGAGVLVLIWFLTGTVLCFLVFPVAVLVALPVPAHLAQRLWLVAGVLGLVGAVVLQVMLGNSRLAILSLLLPPVVWVVWRAYVRMLQPGPRRN